MAPKDITATIKTLPVSDATLTASSAIRTTIKSDCKTIPDNDLSIPYEKFNAGKKKFEAAKKKYNAGKKKYNAAKRKFNPVNEKFEAIKESGTSLLPAQVQRRKKIVEEFHLATLAFEKVTSKFQAAKQRFDKAKTDWETVRDERSPNRKKMPRKKPKAIVPNWTKLCDKDIFFNGRTNEWSIVIFIKEQTNEELLTIALLSIFDQTGLTPRFTTIDIARYIEEGKVFIKRTFIPTRKNLNGKSLCVVPLKKFNEIFEDLLKTPPSIVESQVCAGYFVRIAPPDYNKLFTGLGSILTNVGKNYELAVQKKEYDIPGLRFSNEVKKINVFKKQLNNLFVSNNVSLEDPALEKIGIMFNPDPAKLYKKIESVWVKNIGERWKSLDIDYASFSEKTPANDKTTISFILNMPTIYRKYLSDSSPPYSEFIKNYYYPEPVSPSEVNKRNIQNRKKRAQSGKGTSTGETNSASDPVSYTDPIDPLAIFPGNEVQGMVSNFLENFNDSIPPDFDIGFDWDQRKDLDELIFSNDGLNKRTKDSLNRIQNIADPIINKLKENLDEIGNIKDMYEQLLNPLGVEGIAALLEDAIANLAKILPLEEVIQTMVSSIFEVLEDIDMFDIYRNTVGAEALGEIAAKIESAFADIVWPDLFPDIPLPNIQELFDSLPTVTDYDIFDPLANFVPCVGTPGFAPPGQLGNIKIAFGEMVKRELVPATEIAELLNDIDSIADKDAIKKIFEFSKSGKSGRPGSNAGRSGNTGRGSTFGALGLGNGGGGGGGGFGGLGGGGGRGGGFGGLGGGPGGGFGPFGGGGVGGGFGGRDGGQGGSGRGFSPNFKLGAIDVKEHYKKNLTRKKPRLTPISLPYLPELPTIGFGDLGKVAIKIGIKALEKLALGIIKKLLKKIIDAIFKGGFPPSMDDIFGSAEDALRDTLKNQLLTKETSDGDVNAAMNDLLDSFSIWDPTEPRPSDRDVGNFIDDLSGALSNQQLISLFNGRSDDKTLCEIRQVMGDNISAALPSNGDIDNMFASIGRLLDRNVLQAQKDIDDILNGELTGPLCLTDITQARAENLTRDALRLKPGLSPKDIDDQIEDEKERLLEDLGDLVKALANPEGILTNTGEIPKKPVSNDPRKPEEGLFPMLDEETKAAILKMYEDISNVLNALVITDLTLGDPEDLTSNGFLDMVLADASGLAFNRVLPSLLVDGPEFEKEYSSPGVERFYGDHIRTDSYYYNKDPYIVPDRSSYSIFGESALVTHDDKKIISDLPKAMGYYIKGGTEFVHDNLTYTKNFVKSEYENTTSHFKLKVDYQIGKRIIINDYEQDRYWHKDAKEDQKKKKKRRTYWTWTGDGKSDDPGLDWTLDRKVNIPIAYPVEPAIDDFLAAITPAPQIMGNWDDPTKSYNIFADWLVAKFEEPWGNAKDIVKDLSKELRISAKNVIYESVIKSITEDINFKIAHNRRGWYAIPKYEKYVSKGVGVPTQVFLPEEEYGAGAFYIDYVSETDEDGNELGPSNWIELYLAAAPLEAFGKKDPLFDFLDITRDEKTWFDSMPDDPRLNSDNLLNLIEAPFCRINSRINNTGLAGLVTSLVRLSLYEALLKGLPAFQIFAMNRKNCKAVFVSYIVDKILREVEIESRKIREIYPETLGYKGYYYIFLEQTVQTHANLVNLGFLPLNPDVEFAFDQIKIALSTWIPGDDRDASFKEFLDNQLPSVKKILGEIVRNEMDAVYEKTKHIYRPTYDDQLQYILNQSDFIDNNADPGPIWIGEIGVAAAQAVARNKPFTLEKYLKFIDKSTGDVIYVNQKEAIDLLSIVPGDIPEDSSEKGEDGVAENSTNVGPSIDPQKLLKFNVFGGFRLSAVIPSNSWSWTGGDYLIPLIEGEIPFDADQIKNFNSPTDDLTQKIKAAMSQTTEFKVLFERCFPFSDIFAARTIYIMEAFIPSLTERKITGSLSVFADFFVIPTEFDLWNGRMFETSRKYLKSTIQQYYYGRDASYTEETVKELTPSAKASNLVTKSIVSESVRELGLSRKEMEKMFIVPVGFKLPSKD